MSPDAAQAIDHVLRWLPFNQRLAALVYSLMMDDATGSISNLVEVALVMTRHLSPSARGGRLELARAN